MTDDPSLALAAELSALEALERDGIVELAGRRVDITEHGRPLMRSVCAVFDRHLGATGLGQLRLR